MNRNRDNRNSPLVSVIIPAWNCDDSLARALRSVRDQTYRPLQISIVNDGSTDGTDGVIRDFLSGRPDLEVRYSRQPRRGASAARNAAVAASRGELLSFLDADDTLAADCIRVLADYHRRFPAAGVISAGCRCREYDASGNLASRGVIRHPGRELLEPEEIFPALFCRNLAGMISVLVRRDIFERAGGFDPNLSSCEDLDFWFRAARLASFLLVPEVLGTVEKSPSGLTRSPGSLDRNLKTVLERRRRALFAEFPRIAPKIWRRSRATACLLALGDCRTPAGLGRLLGLFFTEPRLVFSRKARKRLWAEYSRFHRLPPGVRPMAEIRFALLEAMALKRAAAAVLVERKYTTRRMVERVGAIYEKLVSG